ncbi:flavodoxin [Agrilactobacillus composti]|nr:flavodoxin [Agrilactobacillus composti]
MVVYTSMTGNDEEIAKIVTRELEKNKVDTQIQEMEFVDADEFNDLDILVVASYTYDDGEVPDGAMDLYEDLTEAKFPNLVYGVCGSGDTFYEDFCSAVDNFGDKLSNTGAREGAKSVKIELFPEDKDVERLIQFTNDILASANRN